MNHTIKKIVIIGPESTGKSTLCEQLAGYYRTWWLPEFAREFLLKNGKEYTYEDLLTIAKGQLDSEDLLMQKVYERKIQKEGKEFTPSYIFIDTDMYVMKVWCEFVFNKSHQWILDKVQERKYDFYLLCNTDLPWTKDELREYPDLETRQKLFNIYRNILVNQSVPWAEVSGTNEQRLMVAVKEIDDYFGK